jgi:hypothetical protein
MNKKIKIEEAIKNGDIGYIIEQHKFDEDLRFSNDYYLYLSVFHKKDDITEFLIDIGLDPEVTKGRLAVSNPEGLEKIRFLKKQKEIKDYHEELSEKFENKKKIKI